MKKRFLKIFATCVFVALVVVVLIFIKLSMTRVDLIKKDSQPFAGGDGSLENPYQITSCVELQALGKEDYLSSNFILMNDIYCGEKDKDGKNNGKNNTYQWNSGEGFEPIGRDAGILFMGSLESSYLVIDNCENVFSGNIEGNGFHIIDLYINKPGSYLVGLFSFINEKAKVSNINFIDANISGSCFVGGLTGASLNGTIENVYFTGNISGKDDFGRVMWCSGGEWGNYIGGLVGYNKGTIANSFFEGFIKGAEKSSVIGGLIAQNAEGGVIVNSYFIGDIKGDSVVGGLIGYNEGIVEDSYTTGIVSGGENGNLIGGLIGINKEGTIINSHSASNVEVGYNGSNLGGLVGRNYGTIKSSYSTGKITGAEKGRYAGGLAGGNDGTITNSYFTGVIKGGYDVGGLAGDNSGVIANSYSVGGISGESHVGGLVGSNYDTITNSYSTGRVEGDDVIGGLVAGNYNNGVITNSYATGNIVGKEDEWYIGGFAGSNDGMIKSSYSTGKITGAGGEKGSCIGGFVGRNYGEIYSFGWLQNEQINKNLSSVDYEKEGVNFEYKAESEEEFYNKGHKIYTTEDNEWDFNNTWEEQINDYPILKYQIFKEQ
jgi:hypothetical protein